MAEPRFGLKTLKPICICDPLLIGVISNDFTERDRFCLLEFICFSFEDCEDGLLTLFLGLEAICWDFSILGEVLSADLISPLFKLEVLGKEKKPELDK